MKGALGVVLFTCVGGTWPGAVGKCWAGPGGPVGEGA